MFDLLSNLSSGGQAKVDGSQTTMGKTSAGKSIGGGTSDFSQWLNLSPEQQQQAGQNLPLMPGIASQEGLKAPAQFGFHPQLTAEEVASQNLLQDQASDFLSPQTFGQIVTAESAGLSPQPAANSAMSDTLALGEWAHGEKPQNLLQQKPAGLPILASENGSLAAVGPENLSVSPLSAPRGGEAAALAKRPQRQMGLRFRLCSVFFPPPPLPPPPPPPPGTSPHAQ